MNRFNAPAGLSYTVLVWRGGETATRDQNPLLPVGPLGPAKELSGPAERAPENRKEDQDT